MITVSLSQATFIAQLMQICDSLATSTLRARIRRTQGAARIPRAVAPAQSAHAKRRGAARLKALSAAA
jgi:hypothetical protein